MRKRVVFRVGAVLVAVAIMAVVGGGVSETPGAGAGAALAQQVPDRVMGAATAYNVPQLDRSTYLWQHDKHEFMLFMHEFGAEEWTTTALFQNAAGGPLTLRLEFKDLTGRVVKTASAEVPAFGTKEVTGAEVELPTGFRGSLTALGGPAFAVAHHDGKGQNRVAVPAFQAVNCAVPNGIQCGSSTVYLPQVFKSFQGWSSWLLIKNLELSAVISANDLKVVLRDLDWTRNGKGQQLPAPDSSKGWQPDIRNPIAAGQVFLVNLDRMTPGSQASAVITSASGKRMIALAFHTNPANGQSMAISGIGNARGELSLPLVYKNYADLDSQVLVVNLGTATTKPTLSLRLPGRGQQGFLGRIPLATGEGETFRVSGLAGLPAEFVAGATVTGQNATDLFVAQVVTTNPKTLTTMSYRSLLNGSVCSSNVPPLECGAITLYAPAVYNGHEGYSSEIQVQNVQAGDTGAVVVVNFHDHLGNKVATTEPITIPSQTAVNIPVAKVAGVAQGFRGSAIIESRTQTNLAAVVTEVKMR